MTNATAHRISGLDLLVRRRTAGLRQEDVAVKLGVGRTRISALEAMYRPPVPAVRRYLAALDELESAR